MNDKLPGYKQPSRKQHSSVAYYILSIIGLALIAGGLWWAYPPITAGIQQLPNYVNLNWAHKPTLIESLLSMLGMIWLAVSASFWGGWLLKRSFRKIKGQKWRIHVDGKGKIAEFFPPVLRYLKFSCYYLIFVLLFVILQYPVQFLIFS